MPHALVRSATTAPTRTSWDRIKKSTLSVNARAGGFRAKLNSTGNVTLVSPIEIETEASPSAGAAAALLIDNNDVDQIALSFEAANTTADIINVSGAALTSGKVLDMSDLAAITEGKAIHIDATGTTQTSGILVHIDSAGTAITGAGRLLLVDHTGATTTSGTIVEFKSAGADETKVVQITHAGTGNDLTITNTNTGALGSKVEMYHNVGNAASADNDVTGRILFAADDEEAAATKRTVGQIDCLWTDATAASYSSRFIFYTSTAAAQNEAMRILDSGQIQVDTASEINTGTAGGDVFDDYDDAMLLRNWSVDSQQFMETLAEIGVAEKKETGSGWLLNVQQFMYLLAGGIYQNRERIDSLAHQFGVAL